MHFKTYTNHFALKYLVKKPVLGGGIFNCLLLFQEYDFEVVMNPRRINVGPDHLLQIENGEETTSLDEGLLDAQLFVVRIADDQFSNIIHFFTIGTDLEGYYTQEKKELVVRATDFSIIVGHLYKMEIDEILHRYVT